MKCVLQKLSKGSILAYTLILLFIVLTASIGMFEASITNLRSVSSNDKSTNAFQIADSGSQAVVAKIKKASGSTVGDISGIDCSGSMATLSSSLFQGAYKVTFLDADEKTLKCNDDISKITSIKSVGTYADTARAVEVAVASSDYGCGLGQWCGVGYSTYGYGGCSSPVLPVKAIAGTGSSYCTCDAGFTLARVSEIPDEPNGTIVYTCIKTN